MTNIIARIITFLICPFLAYGFGLTIYRIYFAAFSTTVFQKKLIPLAIGFVSFLVFWRIFRRHLQVVCTFEHEVTHLLFGLLFLKMPRSFVVTRHDGGYVEMSGGNFLITLAPYFFPTVSYILLPIAFFISPGYQPVFLGVMGASVAFHLISTWGEIHWRQTDLHQAGILFSLAFLPVANLIFYGALAAAVLNGAGGFSKFWISGATDSFNLLSKIF